MTLMQRIIGLPFRQSYLIQISNLEHCDIKLFLVNCWIAGNVDRAEIVLNLNHYVALSGAQRARNLWIDAERHLFVVALSIHSLGQPSRLFQQFVTDCLRRLYQTAALTIAT